ncbi:prolipoprotein diacylglyceryl transferase [Arthrobacter globiformis NBRC 12137]|uniref:Phosphatidylglycerol--prolipoprotein diacylglyceryl transferase n=1 Tax=Arthrobacter globiformis (strain ATCC 8010 / DSM 20124 / JCM 1332 / NBRC 12137 / NCIMB 8907 / NRRL B-2979 / 168) TaxID=1077972 RepID=H0QL54_ARTG1|nr:prolipoprotein diacylglyceryl transferase [Arthrobacter globiformis]GAB13555.1 prolipoprotein diacylglyceryl transferase [Arthrobacter globiformis NBRC 12137]
MQTLLTAAALVPAGMVPASIPSPDWSGFDIPLPWGSLRIHAYALCILAGIVVGLWLTSVRWAKRGAPEGSVWDIAIWAIPFGIIGGRLYHVFSSPDAYFGPGFDGTGDLSLIPQIQRGGLGIWGAVVLGAFGAWIGCRRAGVKLTAFIDAAAPGLLLAQALGRWGNYFNQELFGGPTTLPWGLQVDADNANFPAGYPANTLFHPTFLYESLWNILGVLILLALDRRFHFRRGRLFWLYAMYYTLGRVWIEAMRIDDAEQISLFGITTRLNVWTSIFVFIAALAVFIVLGRRKDGNADSVYLPGREPAPAAAATAGTPVAEEAGGKRVSGEPDGGTPAVAETAGSAAEKDTPKDSASAPSVTGNPVRDTDRVVSDSESRDNLPDNQNGSGLASAQTEAVPASTGGTPTAAESRNTGKPGGTETGTAPESGSSR